MNRKLWVIALCIWFLLFGLLALSNFEFKMQEVVMGILALAIAVLAVFDK
jgi:hypothetical protein